MPYFAMIDGSGHECTVAYPTLRALLLEKTTTAVPGVTRGPGNPSAWLEFSADLLPNNGRPVCINPQNVSYVMP